MTHDSKLRVQSPRATRRVHEYDIEYSYPPYPGKELDIDSSIEMISVPNSKSNSSINSNGTKN